MVPARAHTLLTQFAALHGENQALNLRIHDLEAQLSANSSRPPSSDPPQTQEPPKALPSGRKRSGRSANRSAIAAPCATGGLNAYIIVSWGGCVLVTDRGGVHLVPREVGMVTVQ
jgi:hypothetical protein